MSYESGKFTQILVKTSFHLYDRNNITTTELNKFVSHYTKNRFNPFYITVKKKKKKKRKKKNALNA